MTKALENQQKALEMKERSDRANNLVIAGIEENEKSTPEDLVQSLITTTLEIQHVKIKQARRLGRQNSQSKSATTSGIKSRPILVTLVSQADNEKLCQIKVNPKKQVSI